jgi:hypothetical protein
MQPYLFPYLGYFQLIHAVDKFVLYDDVNYIKGGWINRNNILINNRKHLFTVSLSAPSPNKLINAIEIKDDFCSLLKTMRSSYGRAPFFQDTFSLLRDIFSSEERNLSRFLIRSIVALARHLGLKTEFIVSSSLEKDKSLKGQEKVLDICGALGAGTYINPVGGAALYDRVEFASRDIALKFLKMTPIAYKQFNGEFVPDLSIVDVMMFNSPEAVREMLDRYELL